MNYYDTNQMQETVRQAFEGDEAARAIISDISVPFAVSQDYSKLILVQEKHAFVGQDGIAKVLNMQPEEGGIRRFVADIYRCEEDYSLWSYIQIPSSFTVREVTYADVVFCFISEDSRSVAGTLEQINRAMFDVSFAVNGVHEEELERCFFSISSTVVDPETPKKTAEDNPPINDKIAGMLIFNEALQQFETDYKANGYSFELCINTDNRKKAVKLIRKVQDILTDLEAFDRKARKFAADELLELKNGAWLKEDEESLTAPEFMSRMAIETLSIDEDGEIEVWYADGDLFWGHSITVSINKKGKPASAEING